MGRWMLSFFFQLFRAWLLRAAGMVISGLAGDWLVWVACIWEKAGAPLLQWKAIVPWAETV